MKGYWISLYTKIENQENQKKFSPFCTLAVMALWYSVDNEPVQY